MPQDTEMECMQEEELKELVYVLDMRCRKNKRINHNSTGFVRAPG